MIPTTYDEWRHCIEQICRIPLTADFIARRLSELNNPQLHSTEQLYRCYGPAHVEAIRGWFRQAAQQADVSPR